MILNAKPSLAILSGLAILAGIGIPGCRTPSVARPAKPLEVVLFVRADAPRWQNSGLTIQRGEIVTCRPAGRWGDRNGSYGPEGNPAILKDHLGLCAPANALLMKIDFHTNAYLFAQVVHVKEEISIAAQASGPILFANNVSLPSGQRGEMKVTVSVAPDTDEDGLSDYDEVTLWKTDPLNADSDGDGFRDGEEAAKQKSLRKAKTAPPPP